MKNHLSTQTSPYLLQHANNPVMWYPWGEEAFAKAKAEDKPIFLSIGYSTCHWCHVMAHESFEDEEIAALLNKGFIAVKVDKEERPDIDSVYMAVTQATTGSGGWPNTVFLTPEQKPFFAGTYFPKNSRDGYIGLYELLMTVQEKWQTARDKLLRSADTIVERLSGEETAGTGKPEGLSEKALLQFQNSYDMHCGGFGKAPKFPAAHNLIFLMCIYEQKREREILNMAEKTLQQMYRGGLFDHIGYGFSRYSTDREFLVPHFEKMLYDNALLIIAYSKMYAVTGKALYREVAEKTADYLCRELKDPEGSFYCAQDADSEGVEGKYYVFTPEEVIGILGGDNGIAFNRNFDITPEGNFEGRSVPNLLKAKLPPDRFDFCLPMLRNYRKKRSTLHLDRKILTAWNALTAAAFAYLFKVTRKPQYLETAKGIQRFLDEKLCDGNELFVSYCGGKAGCRAFLDDYAYMVFALIFLYEATLKQEYLSRARELCGKAAGDFGDGKNGGFHLYGKGHEPLIMKPKETYDGALPSGNSVMAYNLVKLSRYYLKDEELGKLCAGQIRFMAEQAAAMPSGYSFFLTALLLYETPSVHVTAVLPEGEKIPAIMWALPTETEVTVLTHPTEEYKLLHGKTTYYVCSGRHCLPPSNELALS